MIERDQTLTVRDGTDIYIRDLGQGEDLFLLHGNNGDSTYFDKQVKDLARDFHLVLIDFRDHGRSTNASSKLSFEIMAKDLKEVFDHLAINKAHLLGFSDGANLALVFEMMYPDLTNKLVLNSPNVRFMGLTPLSRLLIYMENFLWSLLPFFKRNKRVAGLLLHDLKIDKKDLANISKDVLVIVGSWDLISLEHTKEIASAIPGALLKVVRGAGHKLARTKPDVFNKIVSDFLK